MIGMHPQIRIELARWQRQEQIEAASKRRLETEAAGGQEERPAGAPRRAIPRLRPQQLRP